MNSKEQMPPLMHWRTFAKWIGMEHEHKIVKEWLERGLLPSYKIGKTTMVNLLVLAEQLQAQES